MTSLLPTLREKLAFDEKKLPPPYDMGGDNTDESAVFALGAQAENKRLQPIHEAMLECVQELEDTKWLCEMQQKLLMCYRTGKQPGVWLADMGTMRESLSCRDALAALKKACET